MKNFHRIAFYLFSFGFARGVLFLSPILLANLLPSAVYGTLEWSYAAASVVATLLAVGTSASVPLVELKKVTTGSFSGVLVHQLLVAVGLAVLLVCGVLLQLSDAFVMTTLFTAAIALQVLWSSYLKTHGRGEASLFVDAGTFGLITVVVVAVDYVRSPNVVDWLIWGVACYVFILSSVSIRGLVGRLRDGEVVAYQEVLRLGFPLMVSSVVTVAATTSGRLMVGYLGGVVLAADYSVLARISALPIIAHQIVMVAKFRNLFTLPDRDMERAVSNIIGLVALAAAIFGLSFNSLGWFFGAAFLRVFDENPLPAYWILGQSILWSGIALHDLVNTRYQTMYKVLPWSIFCLILSVPAAVVIINIWGISLANFVYVHGLLMLLFYLNQIASMRRAGIRLVRAWSIAVSGYVLFVSTATIFCL